MLKITVYVINVVFVIPWSSFTHTRGVCAVRNCLWCCVVLHVISLLFLSVSADYLFELADCSASLFVFRDASLVVLHVSFPEEAVSWLC